MIEEAGRRHVRLVGSVVLVCAVLALGACNTVRGFGEDVEALGDTISDVAEEVQD